MVDMNGLSGMLDIIGDCLGFLQWTWVLGGIVVTVLIQLFLCHVNSPTWLRIMPTFLLSCVALLGLIAGVMMFRSMWIIAIWGYSAMAAVWTIAGGLAWLIWWLVSRQKKAV